MQAREGEVTDRSRPGCNVSTTFNFTVGAVAIAAVVVLGYFVYHWLK